MTRFISPEDTSGERKKGRKKKSSPPPNLLFFSDYESGNLQSVKPLNDGIEYEISLRPDTLADQYRNWFYFSVFGSKPNQRVVFSIVNFSKQRSLYRDRMTPLVRSRSKPHLGWSRLPPRNCFYYKSSRHGGSYLLSFIFTFEADGDEIFDFAYSFPYTYTDLQKYLDSLQRQSLPYFDLSLLCRTNQMRRVDLVEIREETKYLQKKKALFKNYVRPVVAITGRVHPGETPASFVVQGFLNFCTSKAEEAVYLRKVVDIFVVPMLNPDGVFVGNYRTDSTGVDLNRRWDAPNKEMEPSLYYTKELLKKIDGEKGRRLDMFIDVHSHSTCKRSFMFCNPPKSMESMNSEEDLKDMSTMNSLKKVLVFLEFLEIYMLEFSLQTCRWDIDSHKVGSARRALEKILPETLCYTFEASFFHDIQGISQESGSFANRRPGQPAQAEINTEKSYIGMGEQLGKAMSHYYKSLEMNLFQTSTKTKSFAPVKTELKNNPIQGLERLKI